MLAAVAFGTVVLPSPSAPSPPGYRTVIDDTGLVSVALPVGWSVVTAPTTASTLDETIAVPMIEAGPVVEPAACAACSPYFAPPTISIRAYAYEPISATADEDCGDPEVVPYHAGGFVGRRETGGGCDAALDRVLASMPGAMTLDALFVYWSVEQPALTAEQEAELELIFETVLSTMAWTGRPYEDSVASAVPPVDTVAGPTAGVGGLWPYLSFHDVPRLGDEPVRGSGCGSRGELGDSVPDGLWAGYLYPVGDGAVELDVACVYEGEQARQVLAEGTATVVDHDPAFLVVNNSTRRRSLSDQVRRVLWGVPDDHGACTPQAVWGVEAFTPEVAAAASGALAWVRVQDGAARWAFFGCDTGYELGG
jgi:hypothetical protein